MLTTSSVQNYESYRFHKDSKNSRLFEERFADFKNLETGFAIFSNSFSVSADEVPQKYQMEVIELQCNSVLNDWFENVDIKTFY